MSIGNNISYAGYNANTPAQLRLNQYDPGELAYDARLASHEQQADGSQEPYGPQGNIFFQTALNGQNNGQAKTFLNTPQRVQWFLKAFLRSVNPQTGQVDGSFLRQAIADSYYQGTGVDILPQLNQDPLLPANTSPNSIYQPFADITQPSGFGTLKQQSGWSDQQIITDALWGHDQFENTQITNPQTRSFLQDALNNPQNMQDYPLVHLSPQTQGYVQNLLNSPTPGNQLDQDFLNLQAQSFSNPNIANPTGIQQPPSPWGNLLSTLSSLISTLKSYL